MSLPILNLLYTIAGFSIIYIIIFKKASLGDNVHIEQPSAKDAFTEAEGVAPQKIPLVPINVTNSIECKHPELNPFDPEMMKFYEEREGDKPYFSKERLLTELKNGTLVELEPESYSCWARCHYFKTYNETATGVWVPAATRGFDCDVIEVRCLPKDSPFTGYSYRYLHTQIIEQSIPSPKLRPTGKQYDVHIIVVDSTSHTQSLRNFPRLKKYIETTFDAIDFPYLNKYHEHSRDNLIAISYGKIQHVIERMGDADLQPEPKWVESCNRNLDDEKRLIREFEEYGYVTNEVDTWWRHALGNLCIGHSKRQSHHLYSPYMTAAAKTMELRRYLEDKLCLEYYVHALQYSGQFFKAYKGKPKFSLTWLSRIGHDFVWKSRKAEPDLIKFFKENTETFDNSFVILMGDHGLRYTKAAQTRLGEYERNNPMLTVMVPSELRKNRELMKTLKRNSRELQTHFDTRATLLDILKFQPKSGYSDRKPLKMNGELGNSFLREQPLPRNCETLPIVREYCICDNLLEIDIIRTEPQTVSNIAEKLIFQINGELKSGSIEEKCGKWKLSKVPKMLLRELKPHRRFEGEVMAINQITERTALFKVFSLEEREQKVIIKNYDRLDSYKDRGDCESSQLRSICDCAYKFRLENKIKN